MNKVYFTECDGLTIMIMRDPDDSWEIYYRMPGWQFIFGFGLTSQYEIDTVTWIAKVNAAEYAEILFV